MSYVWAGYALTWIAMAWFVWRLERRARDAARRLQRTGPGVDAPAASPR